VIRQNRVTFRKLERILKWSFTSSTVDQLKEYTRPMKSICPLKAEDIKWRSWLDMKTNKNETK
jgi:hypothetical protein